MNPHHQFALKKIHRSDLSIGQLHQLYRLAMGARQGASNNNANGIVTKRVTSDAGLIGSAMVESSGVILQLIGPADVQEAERLRLNVSQCMVLETTSNDGTSTGIRTWEQLPQRLAPAEQAG